VTARRRPGLAVLVPVVVLGLLIWATDPRDLAARLGAADPGWLALGLGLLWGQTILSALRWRVTARALGQDLPAGLAVREYLVAQLVNQVLPGGITGDALRAHRGREMAGGLWPALGAVALERTAGQVFMLGALAIGLVLGSALDWPPGLRAVALAGVAIAALVLSAALVARRPRPGDLGRGDRHAESRGLCRSGPGDGNRVVAGRVTGAGTAHPDRDARSARAGGLGLAGRRGGRTLSARRGGARGRHRRRGGLRRPHPGFKPAGHHMARSCSKTLAIAAGALNPSP